MLCFLALTNPSASNSFVFRSIQNAGVSPTNPRPALDAFATDRAKSFRCHTSAKCARNSFPCHTSENPGGGAYIMVNQQQRGCPDLTNRSGQRSSGPPLGASFRFSRHLCPDGINDASMPLSLTTEVRMFKGV